MGGKPGQPKTPGSGRKPGSVNKRTLMVLEKLQLMECDPIAVLALFAKGDWKSLGYAEDCITPDLRADCASDLAQYTAPKLKAIEHSGQDGGPIETEVVYDTQWRDAPATDQTDPATLPTDSGAASGS